MNPLSLWWHTHGTKVLGAVVTVIGAAGESLALIQTMDPKHAGLWALVIGIGGGIVKRGFSNQASTEAAMIAKGWTAPAPPAGAAPGASP